MATPQTSLIPSSLPYPPPQPPSPPLLPVKASKLRSRRTSLLLLSLSAVLRPAPPAFAFSFGISGPKEWLRDQKRKTARFILAPIEASRQSLLYAYSIVTANPPESGAEVDVGRNVRKLLNSASRDCVAEDWSSLVEFQSRTGVEVCTFSLLVKNAASLLDDYDPVKLETQAKLDELVRSFSSVGSLVDSCDFLLSSDRQKVEAGLMETMSALDNFEQGIKNCLGV